MTDQETAQTIANQRHYYKLVDLIAHALAAEREACAKVIDIIAKHRREAERAARQCSGQATANQLGREAEEFEQLADAIRTRGR